MGCKARGFGPRPRGGHSSSMNRSSYQPHGSRSFNYRDPSRARSASLAQREENPRSKTKYHRCGGNHEPSICPYRTNTCFGCGKIGHMKSMCGKYRPEKRSYTEDKRDSHSANKKSKSHKVEQIEQKTELNQVRGNESVQTDSSDD